MLSLGCFLLLEHFKDNQNKTNTAETPKAKQRLIFILVSCYLCFLEAKIIVMKPADDMSLHITHMNEVRE